MPDSAHRFSYKNEADVKILIADDQDMARLVLRSHLKAWGHEVVEATDGNEAYDYIVSNDGGIDLLITDWGMPQLDGLELAHRVRGLSSRSETYIYIILLTGHNDFSDRLLGFSRGGVDDYIVKPFDEAELQHRINVANRLITAERNQRLYSQHLEDVVRRQTEAIRLTQEEIISRLFSALESRDQETGDHVRRIGYISAQVGASLGWNDREVDAIQAAAPLHDIGKIGIGDLVLLKPGRLTPDEFEVIKSHTTIGAHILAGSNNPIIRLAEIIALRHHENWDGSGYPGGLAGYNIPVEARVVAVADFYDALTADRIYRKGLPQGQVLEMIRQESGRKFDPLVATAFLDNIGAICRGLADLEQDSPYQFWSSPELHF